MPLSTAYALAEAVGVERSVSRRISEAPLFLGLFTVQVAVGAIAPVFLVCILLLANRRSVLGDAANGPLFRVVAAVCVAAVAAMASSSWARRLPPGPAEAAGPGLTKLRPSPHVSG